MMEEAIFAGGCFWCLEHPFDSLKGVKSTQVGYTGGSVINPTYKQVCAGNTGHMEAIRVVYDPSQISYEALLEVFWRNIDPTTADRQFCDVGPQYRTAIFYNSNSQKIAAEASKEQLFVSGRFGTIAAHILPASPFYSAEEEHQKFYQKNPARYSSYKSASFRDEILKELWE